MTRWKGKAETDSTSKRNNTADGPNTLHNTHTQFATETDDTQLAGQTDNQSPQQQSTQTTPRLSSASQHKLHKPLTDTVPKPPCTDSQHKPPTGPEPPTQSPPSETARHSAPQPHPQPHPPIHWRRAAVGLVREEVLSCQLPMPHCSDRRHPVRFRSHP